MNSASTVVVSGLIAQYIPVENDLVRMQLGLFAHEILSRGFNQTTLWNRLLRLFRQVPNRVVIREIQNQEVNPVYTFFEEFLVKNHSENLEGCELIPKNGDIELSVTRHCRLTGIEYKYRGHLIKISIQEDQTEEERPN